MSDDETLTLRASGPAEATLSDEYDGVEIATTTEVELEATIDVDAEWLREHGYPSKNSKTRLYPDDVARLVCERRSGEDGTFEPLEGWTLTLSGRFRAWASVAYTAADELVRSDTRTANAMCHILSGLAEHAADDRPRLVMVDVLGSYDPSDYSRENVLSEVAASAETTPEATADAEAIADD